MTYYGTFIFPETGQRSTGRLTVGEGRIVSFEEARAQKGDTELSGTLTPGLIDAHVHLLLNAGANPVAHLLGLSLTERVLMAQAHMKAQLEAGVTTVRDLGGPDNIAVDLGRAVMAGRLTGPRVQSSGRNLTMTGGHGHALGLEVDGPDAVRRAARGELKAGAQVIKFMATGGVLTPNVRAGATALNEDEMRAGVEAAHNADKRTAAHAQGLAGIKNALRAGVDTIEHGAFDRWDDDALALLETRFLVPTLAAPDGILSGDSSGGKGDERGNERVPDWVLEKTRPIAERHRANTTEAYRAGVPVVAGTDAGTPFNPHGNLPKELALLAEVGLSPLDVLRAATTVAADALHLAGQVGTLRPGAFADLVAWDGDPLEGVSAYARPRAVVVGGKVKHDFAQPSGGVEER